MGIRIITDSTSDISLAEAKEIGVTIVPLKVIFGDKEYKEGIDITLDDFYNKLAVADTLPTTSQPSPDDFLNCYLQAKEAGDSVVVILIAEKLSGTVQSAVIAQNMAEYEDIHIIDSLTTITGLRLLVNQAVALRKQGLSAAQITDQLELLKNRIVLFAMVDTLEYLYKGGRLSRSSAFLGSLLKFKPIITLKDGALGVLGKERGANKAISRLIEIIEEHGKIDKEYPVYYGYTFQDEQARLLRDNANRKYGLTDTSLHPVGCVVGAHVGPGACVITYIRKENNN